MEFLPDSGHALPSESGMTKSKRPRLSHIGERFVAGRRNAGDHYHRLPARSCARADVRRYGRCVGFLEARYRRNGAPSAGHHRSRSFFMKTAQATRRTSRLSCWSEASKLPWAMARLRDSWPLTLTASTLLNPVFAALFA